MRCETRHFLIFASALAAITVARPAAAHTVGLSRGDYAVDGATIVAKLTLARGELATAVPGLDADHDGTVNEHEVASGEGAFKSALVDTLHVSNGGAACAGTFERAALTEQDGVELTARYRCAAPPSKIAIEADFLDTLPLGHRHVAHFASGSVERDEVLHKNKKRVEVDLGAPAPEARSWHSVAWGFFVQGIEHILTGYDHLAFLLGLVVVRGKLKSVLALVTAFTLAHSVTLALAVLGVFAPSPRFTEPAIALSVAYVGVENFYVKDLKNRWRLTALFGLVHGFGFAGALGEISLPRPQIPLALATFNLGVEAGQLSVLALVLPLVHLARKRRWFDAWGVKAISAALTALGVVWFVSRVVWPPS